MIGTTIAHYRITDKLGEGGMGEVYRARDDKLNRDVALKILPEALATDSGRMSRFQREAEVLASLSHAHIGQIYGIEQAGATKALVLELIEGPTLAERISAGPMPWREALELAVQIANALEAAHEKGIVHRDLKPANIKVTSDDQIKVLDFGLAKAVDEDADASSELSHSPTLSMGATRAGVILGTAAYMSPEQARGKPVDKRTDIFAFGAVLFEMLTGRKAFLGEDASLTLAAVMKEEPEWELMPRETPAALQRLLRRCVAKSPLDRFRDIGDVRYEIGQVLAGPDAVQGEPAPTRSPAFLVALAAGTGLLAGVLVTAMWLGTRTSRSADTPSLRAELLSPDRIQISQFTQQLAISPDGSRVVFRTEGGGRLLQRKLGDPDATEIAGTEHGSQPFISPDGKWLAFYTSNQLKKVPIDGGVPEILTDAYNSFGSTWQQDDKIFLVPHPGAALHRVSANGGAPEPLVSEPELALSHHRPSTLLPDGKHLLICIWSGFTEFDLALLDLDTGAHRTLLENVPFGRYLPSGHIVFPRADGLYAVRFDTTSLTLTGPEVPVVRDAFIAEGTNLAQFDVSANGTLVYVPGKAPRRELVIVDRSGRPTPLTAPPRHYQWPRFSPDGSQIAVTLSGIITDTWIVDAAAGALTRMTRDANLSLGALWTADGTRLVYSYIGSKTDRVGVYSLAADGSDDVETVLGSNRFGVYQFDGTGTVFGLLIDGSIATLDVNARAEPTVIVPLRSGIEIYNPSPSPDGRWVAYVSNESGAAEVYVTPVAGTGEKRLVSRNGGGRVLWRGDEIFFVSASTMMVVEVTGPDAELSEPKPLFSVEPFYRGNAYVAPNWDVSADGQQFVMTRFVEEPDTAPPHHLEIVTNFYDELREKVP